MTLKFKSSPNLSFRHVGQTLSVLLLVAVALTAPQHLELAVVAVVAVEAGRGVVGVHAPTVLIHRGRTLGPDPQDGGVERLLSVLGNGPPAPPLTSGSSHAMPPPASPDHCGPPSPRD